MIRLHRRSFAERPAYDTAVSRALLQLAAAGRAPETLRVCAAGEALAFSVLDRTRPGFAAAVAAAREHGFEPLLRLAGGRAAVFHPRTLSFAWSVPCPDPRRGIRERFEAMAGIARGALRRLGVDARVGEVPGEYCPGAHSVNARGRTKLVGIGQRVIRGAAYVGGVVVVGDAARVRAALLPVYAALGLDFDPETVGSVEDELGPVDAGAVIEALLGEFRRRGELVEAELGPEPLALARQLEAEHRLEPGLQPGLRNVEESQDGQCTVDPAAR